MLQQKGSEEPALLHSPKGQTSTVVGDKQFSESQERAEDYLDNF